MKTIQSVEAHQIPSLKFPTKDVLTSDKDRHKREILLQQALAKGNSYDPEEANIVFRSRDGIMKVTAEVIAKSKAKITLRGFNKLPIKSIIGLQFSSS